MLNFLWAFMILTGIIYAAFTGNLPAVTDAAFAAAQESVTLCITMAGILAFWVGIMRIAEDAGIMERATRRVYPLLHFIFPRIPKDHPAMQAIAINCIANFFALGWASTPAGLEGMKHLDELEKERTLIQAVNHSYDKKFDFKSDRIHRNTSADGRSKSASFEMCAFLTLNISSVQLIPVSVIAFRSKYGSANPTGFVGAAIVATAISTLTAVMFIKIMYWWDVKRGY